MGEAAQPVNRTATMASEAFTAPDEPRGSSRSIFLPREFEHIMMVAKSDAILNRDPEVCPDAYELAMATGMRVGELCSRV